MVGDILNNKNFKMEDGTTLGTQYTLLDNPEMDEGKTVKLDGDGWQTFEFSYRKDGQKALSISFNQVIKQPNTLKYNAHKVYTASADIELTDAEIEGVKGYLEKEKFPFESEQSTLTDNNIEDVGKNRKQGIVTQDKEDLQAIINQEKKEESNKKRLADRDYIWSYELNSMRDDLIISGMVHDERGGKHPRREHRDPDVKKIRRIH
jgi:hypothetical protein